MGKPYEPFHIRQRDLERKGEPAVYRYDELPDPFRTQAVRILEQVIGDGQGQGDGGLVRAYADPNNEPFGPGLVWRLIGERIADELGSGTGKSRGFGEFLDLMFRVPKVTVYQRLTGIEIAFMVVAQRPEDYQASFNLPLGSRQAIDLLNRRFRQHDLGYAFAVDRIIRIDSQYLHSQTVDPALQLLTAKGFQGAEHEFLKAHEHYRHGQYDDAVVDAARAFESTMKSICDEMKWEYSGRATVKDLIRVVSEQGLFPEWHDNHVNSLRSVLEGLATVRNKNGSHGTGSEKRDVPDHMAALAIHLAGSNIVFMVESFERLRGE